MKGFALFLVIAASAILLSGCSSGAKENRFTFATWAAGTELAEFQEIVNKVNEQANGEYVIEVQSIPSDYYIKLSTQIAAKRTPDFFWMTQELISKYADMGAIADLTNLFQASEKLKPSQYYEGVLASAVYKEKYWGHPWIANPLIVYYNKTLFNELGVTPPSPTEQWTWEEFIETARQLTGKTSSRGDTIYGYIVDGWPNIETFFWAGGGDIVAEDNKTILLDSPESIKGVSYLQTILKEGLTPSYAQVSSLGANNVWFEKQRVAMFMGGVQDNFEEKVSRMAADAQFEIGYAPMPVSLDGHPWSFNWTASTVMSKALEGNELAYRALEDLTLAFFTWKIAPPIPELLSNLTVIAPLKENAMETIAYTMPNARSAHYTPEWSDINNSLWYDLYVKMLNDPNFDYESQLKTIADSTRAKMPDR